MSTSLFFNLYEVTPEQNLLNDLAEEMIKIHGINVYYIPRKHVNIDALFGEDSASEFDNAILIEMYLKNYLGFGGDGDMMSKFGLMTSDTLTLCVARRRFDEEIGRQFNFVRPQEGDLIYFPFTKGIFEIKFVEHEATFYQTGALQFFELRCEKFNYSDEKINTGIADIDNAQINNSTASDNFRILTEAGNWLITQDGNDIVKEDYARDTTVSGAENDFFQDQSNTFIDFTIADPFSEGGRF